MAVFDPENAKDKIIEDLKNPRSKGSGKSAYRPQHAWDHYQYVTVQKDISGSVNINEARLHELQNEIKAWRILRNKSRNSKARILPRYWKLF